MVSVEDSSFLGTDVDSALVGVAPDPSFAGAVVGSIFEDGAVGFVKGLAGAGETRDVSLESPSCPDRAL